LNHPNLQFTSDSYQAAADADAVVVATEWNEFRNLDLGKLKEVMKGDVLLDARNCIDPDAAVANNLTYLGRGRKTTAVRREATVAA
jgi:UDPglucose 6-dehydrogenase